MTEHNWVCISHGIYESTYQCVLCRKTHTESMDNQQSKLPKGGCEPVFEEVSCTHDWLGDDNCPYCRIEELEYQKCVLIDGIRSVENLIDSSDGVLGIPFHDKTSWVELREGGVLSDWLSDFDSALLMVQQEAAKGE